MASPADAFIALPDGLGTLEEFCEVVKWTQLGLHCKRCGLLNVGGFYDPLLAVRDELLAGNCAIVVPERTRRCC